MLGKIKNYGNEGGFGDPSKKKFKRFSIIEAGKRVFKSTRRLLVYGALITSMLFTPLKASQPKGSVGFGVFKSKRTSHSSLVLSSSYSRGRFFTGGQLLFNPNSLELQEAYIRYLIGKYGKTAFLLQAFRNTKLGVEHGFGGVGALRIKTEMGMFKLIGAFSVGKHKQVGFSNPKMLGLRLIKGNVSIGISGVNPLPIFKRNSIVPKVLVYSFKVKSDRVFLIFEHATGLKGNPLYSQAGVGINF